MRPAPDDPRVVVVDHDTGDVVGSYRRTPNLIGRAVGLAGSLVGLGRRGLELPRSLVGATSDPISGDGHRVVAVVDQFGDIEMTRDDLAAAHPVARGDLVVLVAPPGIGIDHWRQGMESTGASYGDRLQALLGWSSVTVRLDRVPSAEGGVALSGLLQQLVDLWPVPVERIAVVAAREAGLVVRRASAVPSLSGRSWTGLVSDVVLLGTTPYAAGSRPLTGPIGRRLDAGLGGIAGAEEAEQVPGLRARYRLITDRPVARPTALGQFLGNLLWLRHRIGPAVVELFPEAIRIEVVNGPPLANHPEVHSGLLDWLR